MSESVITAIDIDAGYWIEDGVLSADECDSLLAALAGPDAAIKRSRAGARHLMANDAVAALASDERLLALARRELGLGAVPFRATLFDKSATANWLVVWHQDTALPLESRFDDEEWGPWSLKEGVDYAHAPTSALSRILALRVHIDASTSQNGPLRVLPGSQALGVLSDEEVHDRSIADQPAECLVGRGGVLAMRPLLIHASSKANSPEPRRVLHIEYAESLDLGPGIRLAIA